MSAKDIKRRVFVGKPKTSLICFMSSPAKTNAAASKTPIPEVFVVSDGESEPEDLAEIEWQAEEARKKADVDLQARWDVAKAKAQHRKEREEAKAAEVQKRREAEKAFRKVAGEAAKAARERPEENRKWVLAVSDIS